MIEIFRQCNTSIYMRFDGKGYEDLLKMLDEILAGKEVALDVVFDMSVIKMKKKAARQRTSIIHPNDSGNGPSIDFPHGKSEMHGQ